MKLKLKDFQEQAVAKLVRYLRGASREARSGDLQSVCLSSATGSGKTVMLTMAIESILTGDSDNPPMANASFLWITDQPELNEQTRKKMLATSSVLGAQNLVVIDAAFDQETLSAGSVHFLNIQKLGKDKGLVTQGDKRTFTIWEIIKNTIDARPDQFFVIVDEAHRGMAEDKATADAASIVQKFIKGSSGEIPPVPVVVGISATPERFNRLIVGTSRMSRPVDVDIRDVRESGLIKDTVVLHHPSSDQPTDMTMLREAARSIKRFTSQWDEYCAKNGEEDVNPLLVVQVEDAANKQQISQTDIGEAILLLESELGQLPSDAFAHSFQEGNELAIGGRSLRYIAPSEISADRDARVVFFKTSLNTGWDCPRAEVMMSFRNASDSTYIAQLVGRMVRTPFARRIIDNESLNTVSLFLPHYDAKSLARVIEKLSRPDETMAPVAFENEGDGVDLVRSPGSEQLFDALSSLPSYLVPRQRKANQVRRLMKLARALSHDEIALDALKNAKSVIVSEIDAELIRREGDPDFVAFVEGKRKIELDVVNWDVGTESHQAGDKVSVDIASENVEDLFEATGRRLQEGLHKEWWRKRHQQASGADSSRIKLELFALCVDPDFIRRLELTAQATVQAWLTKFRDDIRDLDEGAQEGYTEIQNLASEPELKALQFPSSIRAPNAGDSYAKHVYVNSEGQFSAKLNSVEAAVVKEAIKEPSCVGWLRNTDRKAWSLSVPYQLDGEDRQMFPDFLFIRKVGKRHVVDIVEPHSMSLSDAPAKAAGLARFAAKHANAFGKIELILVDGKNTKRLDLVDEQTRLKVQGASTVAQLKALF